MEKISRKVLSINPKPFIYSYTQHGFFHAIASANDKVNLNEKESVADVSIDGFHFHEWMFEKHELTYDLFENDYLSFYANNWNHGMNMAFWRDCKSNDKISIVIYKQLYSNAWSNISLFLTRKNSKEMTQLNSYDFSVGNFAKDGVFYSNERGFHNRIHSGIEMPIEISLTVEGSNLYYEYENNDFKSERQLVGSLEGDNSDYYIGFSVNLGNSIYYEWMFSNYIQLFSRTSELMPIDFIVNWHRDWCVHTANHIMEYNKINQDELHFLNLSLIEFVKAQINMNWYVELELNDNLKLACSEEREPYFHQNLVYGYDDEKQCFDVLYYREGNIAQTKISYSDFESDRNYKSSRMLYLIKYYPCYEKYEISTKRLLNVFKEYQKGENISYFDSFYDGYFLGADCYRQYCNKELLEESSWDVRFTHLLYERSVCNRKRVEYLRFIDLILEKDYIELTKLLEEEAKLLLRARSSIVKSIAGGRLSINRIQKYMSDAFENDQKFTSRIIECLSMKL